MNKDGYKEQADEEEEEDVKPTSLMLQSWEWTGEKSFGNGSGDCGVCCNAKSVDVLQIFLLAR